jgi:hypothetical protein
VQAAGLLGRQAFGGELNSRGIDRQRNVETVIHEELIGRGGPEHLGEREMIAAGE